jgi:hypothetical protein
MLLCVENVSALESRKLGAVGGDVDDGVCARTSLLNGASDAHSI